MPSSLSSSHHEDELADALVALSVDHIASHQASPDTLLTAATAVREGPLFYLRNRDRSMELLGIGGVLSFKAQSLKHFQASFEWLMPALRCHPHRHALFLLGGTSFDGERPGTPWEAFGGVHFIIPRCLLLRKESSVDVFLIGDREGPIIPADPASHPNSGASWEGIEPNSDEWNEVISVALDQISAGAFEKVVLARRAHAKLDAPIHPIHVLSRLLSSPQRVAGFAFAPSTQINRCFFGATPELLFTLKDEILESEAVAGTLQAQSPQKWAISPDSSLMIPSQKEREEHEYVVSAIVNRLQSISDTVEAETEPYLSPLHDLYHLVTPIRARLKKAISPLDIIALLHPTPAVCGSPQEKARAFIRAHEPFERGWYAGTIGFFNAYHSEFSVGLRSALLDHQRLSAYVGAGIVRGSTAAKEWEELDLKQRRLEDSIARTTPEERTIER